MFLTSHLIDAPHGFTTREGGVSTGPYARLNLSRTVGDDARAVAENARRFARAARLTGPVVTARQMHGDRVVRADRPTGDDPLPLPVEQADALVLADLGCAVGIKTADCVPILAFGPKARVAAAIHAGWRGTRARVAARAIETLDRDFGASPDDVRAAIGPAIGPCCFEVHEDVAGLFEAEFPEGVVTRRDGRPYVDLWTANRLILLAAGVSAGNIDEIRRCTRCEADLFFSHRRDRGVTGRHLAYIALP